MARTLPEWIGMWHAGRVTIGASALLVGCVTAAAWATPIETTLAGSVLASSPGSPATGAALEAHGVIPGATATVTIVVESATPPRPSTTPPFVIYDDAIVELVVRVGTYQASRVGAPAGAGGQNQVIVGNDLQQQSAAPIDTYNAAASGADTDGILAGGGMLTLSLLLSDTTGTSMESSGVVQDLGAFPIASIAVGGVNGSFSIVLARPGAGARDPRRCRAGQLGAGRGLCRAALVCRAKRARRPSRDLDGAREAACLADAADRFASKYARAVSRGTRRGGTCLLAAPATEVSPVILEGVGSLADTVLAGAHPTSAADAVLRAALLRGAAGACARELRAYAKEARRPSPARLARLLGKSEGKLAAAVTRATAKAARGGVVYEGPDAQAIGAAIREITDTLDARTAGTLEATVTPP